MAVSRVHELARPSDPSQAPQNYLAMLYLYSQKSSLPLVDEQLLLVASRSAALPALIPDWRSEAPVRELESVGDTLPSLCSKTQVISRKLPYWSRLTLLEGW